VRVTRYFEHSYILHVQVGTGNIYVGSSELQYGTGDQIVAYKNIGVCQQCQQPVFAPMRAKYLGKVKQCKHCRTGGRDEAAESERRYFEKFDGGWQYDVQGFTSSP